MNSALDEPEDAERPVTFDREALASAARQYGLRLIVLYGSHARRRARPDSDLDLAVLGCEDGDFRSCYEALGAIFAHCDLDLVRLEAADPLFRDEVMRDAVLLHGDPLLFCEYRAFAYRDFIDSADLFALEDKLSRKKMARIAEALHGTP